MKTKFPLTPSWKALAYTLLIFLHAADHVRCRSPSLPSTANRTVLNWRVGGPQDPAPSKSLEYRTGQAAVDRTLKLHHHRGVVDEAAGEMSPPAEEVSRQQQLRDVDHFVSYFADDVLAALHDRDYDEDAGVFENHVIVGTDLVDGAIDYVLATDDVVVSPSSSPTIGDGGPKDVEVHHRLRHAYHGERLPGMRKLSASSGLSSGDGDDDDEGVVVAADDRGVSRKKRLLSQDVDSAHHDEVTADGRILSRKNLLSPDGAGDDDDEEGVVATDARSLSRKKRLLSQDVDSTDHDEGTADGRVLSRKNLLSSSDVDSAGEDDEEGVMAADPRSLSRKKRLLSQDVDDEPLMSQPPTRVAHSRRQHRRRQHRRRQRQRLILKAQGGHPKFPLKSDGPSYLITGANEIKRDWCKTVPLKQRISAPLCRPKEIMNNFCYGQCNSFFIPHPGRVVVGEGANPAMNRVAFQSCPSCKPHRFKYVDVALHCPGQSPPKVSKRVLVVESCRCKADVLP